MTCAAWIRQKLVSVRRDGCWHDGELGGWRRDVDGGLASARHAALGDTEAAMIGFKVLSIARDNEGSRQARLALTQAVLWLTSFAVALIRQGRWEKSAPPQRAPSSRTHLPLSARSCR